MCDFDHNKVTGWQGWMTYPPVTAGTPAGEWIDLSHVLDEDVVNAEVFPTPRFTRLKSKPKDPLNVTEMQMVVHTGTHVDAPMHFLADGPAFDEIPLDRLYGPGVVVDCAAEDFGEIGADDLAQAAGGMIAPGDIVALHTGWSEYADQPRYHDHPHLGADAARWLVDQKIKLLAVDFPSPDMAISRRQKGFNWPVHYTLLGNGVLVSENIRGLRPLAGRRAEFMFSALNIRDSDGAPARVMARPLQ